MSVLTPPPIAYLYTSFEEDAVRSNWQALTDWSALVSAAFAGAAPPLASAPLVPSAPMTQTNSTTPIVAAGITLGANTPKPGEGHPLRAVYRFDKTVAPPTITAKVKVNGVTFASVTITSVSSATTSYGQVSGLVVVTSLSTPDGVTPGTGIASLFGQNNHGATDATNWNPASIGVLTTLDSAVDNLITLELNMDSAVAANTLTVVQGFAK